MKRVSVAADMRGAGYILTGEHDAGVMNSSASINLNTVEAGRKAGVKPKFYFSSACICPDYNQEDPNNPVCSEELAHGGACCAFSQRLCSRRNTEGAAREGPCGGLPQDSGGS
jgi:hypothetical protein